MNEEKLLEVINHMRKRREDAQNKIERLKKENEWLITQYARETTADSYNRDGYKEEVLKEMQQALKGV